MRRILPLLLLLAAPAHAAIQLAPVRASVTTSILGTGSLSVKIPGTFAGLAPADPTAVRYLSKIAIWADSPADGDFISSIAIQDTDGVIPVPARAAFPNYPIIAGFLESGVADGGWLKTEGMTIEPLGGVLKTLPSGLYITALFTSGGLSLGKIFRVNILWGYYIPD